MIFIYIYRYTIYIYIHIIIYDIYDICIKNPNDWTYKPAWLRGITLAGPWRHLRQHGASGNTTTGRAQLRCPKAMAPVWIPPCSDTPTFIISSWWYIYIYIHIYHIYIYITIYIYISRYIHIYICVYIYIYHIYSYPIISWSSYLYLFKITPFMGVSCLHLASNAPPCLSRVRIMFCGATRRHMRIMFVTCATARLGLAASFGGEIEGTIGLLLRWLFWKTVFSSQLQNPLHYFMSWNGRCYNSINFVRPISRSHSSTRQRLGDSTRWKQASIFGGAVLDPSGWTVDSDVFKTSIQIPRMPKLLKCT